MISRLLSLIIIGSFCCQVCFAQIDSEKELLSQEACKGPAWLRDIVIYSIFPRDFSKSGDFLGVTQRLNQIKELGVDVIWLLPIHPIGELKKKGTLGSPYAIRDYEKINPDYGTPQDLKDLVTKAHELGLKVMMDAVLNHTAWDNVLMKDSSFYRCNHEGQIIPPLPEWSDVAALNYSNPNVQSYVLNLLKYWLVEFNLDGFRFDASDFIPLSFWKKVREELRHLKSDIILLGEGEKPEALYAGFDLDYDWKFKNALDNILIDGAPATETIQKVLKKEEELFPVGALHLRFSDNHDERRAIARYGEKGALSASALIFTLEGVPLIYNGMEVGDTTESRDPALFEKMPIFWDASIIRPNFKSFYTKMIALRKEHPALRNGKLKWVRNPNEERILTYLRTSDEETLFLAINLSNQPFTGRINLEVKGCAFEELWQKELASSCSLPALSLGAYEFRIYKMKF